MSLTSERLEIVLYIEVILQKDIESLEDPFAQFTGL